MSMVGLELNEHEQIKLDNMLKECLQSKQQEIAEVVADETPRVTIQDRLREKVSECAGELDGMFDEFIASGAKMSADFKPIVLMRGLWHHSIWWKSPIVIIALSKGFAPTICLAPFLYPFVSVMFHFH